MGKVVKKVGKKLVKKGLRAGAAYVTGGASEGALAAMKGDGGSSALKIGAGLLNTKKKRRAEKRRSAAEQAAAQQAAIQSSFRPVGVTTRFGQSSFMPDGSGSYTLSPEARAQQDRFAALSNQALAQAERAGQDFAPLGQAAQGLFSLGRGYLAETPEQAAAKFMAQQQNLLAPTRERRFSQLQNSVFNTGRQGLAVGGTGMRPGGGAGLGSANPDLEAYYNVLAQEDAELATRATLGGMDQTRFGASLFDTGSGLIGRQYAGQVAALGPYEQYLAQMKGLEGLGQQTYEMGQRFGELRRNDQGGRALYEGGLRAAGTRYGDPSSNTADILSGLANSDTLFSRPPANTGFFANRDPSLSFDSGKAYNFGQPQSSGLVAQQPFNYGGYTSPIFDGGGYRSPNLLFGGGY